MRLSARWVIGRPPEGQLLCDRPGPAGAVVMRTPAGHAPRVGADPARHVPNCLNNALSTSLSPPSAIVSQWCIAAGKVCAAISAMSLDTIDSDLDASGEFNAVRCRLDVPVTPRSLPILPAYVDVNRTPHRSVLGYRDRYISSSSEVRSVSSSFIMFST